MGATPPTAERTACPVHFATMSDGVNSEHQVEWYLAGLDGKPWGP
jgi:hypothetical protein